MDQHTNIQKYQHINGMDQHTKVPTDLFDSADEFTKSFDNDGWICQLGISCFECKYWICYNGMCELHEFEVSNDMIVQLERKIKLNKIRKYDKNKM